MSTKYSPFVPEWLYRFLGMLAGVIVILLVPLIFRTVTFAWAVLILVIYLTCCRIFLHTSKGEYIRKCYGEKYYVGPLSFRSMLFAPLALGLEIGLQICYENSDSSRASEDE
jgi:heme A synthase